MQTPACCSTRKDRRKNIRVTGALLCKLRIQRLDLRQLLKPCFVKGRFRRLVQGDLLPMSFQKCFAVPRLAVGIIDRVGLGIVDNMGFYALYNATKYVCHWNPVFAEYLAKKRAEGKHYNVALSHATKKLVRLIYALQKSGKAYLVAA